MNRTRSKRKTVDGPERQPQTKDGQAPVPRVRVFPIMSLLRSERQTLIFFCLSAGRL